MKKYFLPQMLLISFFLVTSLATAADNKQLNNLTSKISSLKASLINEQSQREKLQNALQSNEIQTGKIALQLTKTNSQLKNQQILLNQLQQDAQDKKNLFLQQQDQLAQQLRAAYILSRQPYLKLLFNQNDLDHLSRTLVYYKFMVQDQVQTLKNIQQTLNDIQTSQTKIVQQMALLQNTQQQQLSQEKSLSASHQARQSLIATMNKSIFSKTQEMQTLIANKLRLENTISQLQNSKFQYIQTQNFSKLIRKLPWPTRGKIQYLFGTNIQESELRWNGDIILASQGQPVYAVANGEVVFAKWLEGYGLLLIINHGNGYMTLYGRNQYLYKQVGDKVVAGDLIASVGNTGGYENSGLYFAIRLNAKPLDPALWCTDKIHFG